MKFIRKKIWQCPHCNETLIVAEVELPTIVVEDRTVTPPTIATHKGKNTLRIMSESDYINELENYIKEIEEKS